MAIVGSATIIIRAITDKLEGDIKNALNKVKPAAGAAGSSSGMEFSKYFGKHASQDGNSLFGKIKAAASRSGNDSGRSFAGTFISGAVSFMGSGASKLANIGSGMGATFGVAFRDAFKNSGAGNTFIAIGLRIAALLPILGALVGAISNVVSGLFAMAAAAGTAVNSLIVLPSIVMALVQAGVAAIVAFGGVGGAISAGFKAATATTAEAAREMANKARDAAEAVSDAQRNLRDAHERASDGIQNALEGIRSARQRVHDAYRNAARSEEDAIEGLRRAEEGLARAHDRVRDAQEQLTEARKAAKEELIDLQFTIEQNQLAERRAQLALSDAKFELDATAGLPESNRARMEAELAFKEADLELRMIRERQKDLQDDQKKANKDGVNGSDRVKSAKEQLSDAEDGVRDAVDAVSKAIQHQTDVQRENTRAIQDSKRALGDAKEALGDAYRDGPEMISDAQRALEDAKEAQLEANKAMAAGSTEAQKYQEELEKLSPAARSFVEYMVSIRDNLLSLRKAAAEGLFPGLQSSMEILVTGLFPSLEKMFKKTGQAVGSAAKSMAKSMTTGPFVESFGRVTGQNATTIRRLGRVMGDLTAVVFTLLDGARPLIDEFTKWFVLWSDNLRVTTEAKNKTGELGDSFLEAGERMKTLIRITKNIVEGFYDIGKVAKPSGLALLEAFENYTERFANFTDNPKNVEMLEKFFNKTRKNFLAIASLIHEIGAAFGRLGADPAVGKFATALEPTIKKIEDLITKLLDKSGDDLVEFVNSILDTFSALADSKALNIFLGIMTGFFKTLTSLLKTPVIGETMLAVAGLGAAIYAIQLLSHFPGLGMMAKGFQGIWFVAKNFKVIPTWIRLMWLGFKSLRIWTLLSSAALAIWRGVVIVARNAQMALNLAWALNPIGLVIGVIALVIAAVVLMYKKWDWFGNMVDKIWTQIVKGAQWLWDVLFGHSIFPDILDAMRDVWEAVSVVIDTAWTVIKLIFKAMSRFVKGVLIPVFKWLFKMVKHIFNGIGAAIRFVWNKIIKPIFTAYKFYITKVLVPIFLFLWRMVKLYFKFIGEVIKFVWTRVIKPVFKALSDFIDDVLIPIIKWLWREVIKPIFNSIGDLIRKVWENAIRPAFRALRDFIKDTLPSAFEKGVEAIGKAWDGLKKLAGKPVNFVIDTIYNNGIRKLVNKVLGFFGSDKELGTVKTVDWGGAATGKVIPGYTPGRDIGYIGVSGGEAVMRPEWTRAIGKERVNKMNAAARTGGIGGVKKFLGGFASGGIPAIGGWSQHSKDDYPNARWAGDINVPGSGDYGNPVRAWKDGIVAAVTYLGDRSYGRFAEINHPASNEQTLYAHLSSAAVKAGQAVKRGQMIGRVGDLGNASGPHLHFEIKGGTGAIQTGSTGDGEQDGGGIWTRIVRGTVNKLGGLATDLIDKIPGVESGFGKMISMVPKSLISNAKEYLLDKFGASAPKNYTSNAGAVLSSATLTTRQAINEGIVKGVAASRGWEKSPQWPALRELIMRESSFDNLAQNPNSSAYGLFQFLDSTWGGVGGRKTSDPKLQSIYGLKYIAQRYNTPFGALNFHDNNGWYDHGGIARGEDAWMPKRTARPERVLSPRQTEAFERMVELLDQGQGAGGSQQINLEVNVPHDASAKDVVDGIVYELRRTRSVRGGRYRS